MHGDRRSHCAASERAAVCACLRQPGHGAGRPIGRAMPHGDILGYAPPLIIIRDEIDIIVDATAKSVDTTYRALKAEGVF